MTVSVFLQTRDPRAVQPHMRKCFDSIQSILFAGEEGSPEITGELPNLTF
jgi:hypothetical protein